MAKAKSDAAAPGLDELIADLVGQTCTVRQPGKGEWSDPATGDPIVYTVAGVAEPEEGEFTVRLESAARLRRFVPADPAKRTDARWEATDLPRSVVPNCPLKWIRPVRTDA